MILHFCVRWNRKLLLFWKALESRNTLDATNIAVALTSSTFYWHHFVSQKSIRGDIFPSGEIPIFLMEYLTYNIVQNFLLFWNEIIIFIWSFWLKNVTIRRLPSSLQGIAIYCSDEFTQGLQRLSTFTTDDNQNSRQKTGKAPGQYSSKNYKR